mgnify:CR=1 FL=1
MPRFDIGDLVSYKPAKTLPSSLGFIIKVKDGDLVKVSWYISNVLPVSRTREWIPASILEDAGTFNILSKKLDSP